MKLLTVLGARPQFIKAATVSRAIAAMDGRVNISIQDIRDVAVPVLRHRIAANFQAQAEGIDSTRIVGMLLDDVPEPEVPKYERSQP